MAPELKTPDMADEDLRAAFRLQSPLEQDLLDGDDMSDRDGDDALDRQIFAGLVTP